MAIKALLSIAAGNVFSQVSPEAMVTTLFAFNGRVLEYRFQVKYVHFFRLVVTMVDK
jgi:hypothetical protein